MRSIFLVVAASALLILSPAETTARVYSPRVNSPHAADTYSMLTFAEHAEWKHLKGDERTWQVFQYLTDERTGLFPLGMPVREGGDVLEEFLQIRDPVKLINVYGYGYCGILGPTMAGVCEQMGIGPSRALALPGWHHVVGETFYDNRWHYLDLDVRAVFRRPDGRLASMAEAQGEDALWNQKDRRLFFPLDPIDKVRDVYRKTPVHHYYGHHYGGHTMDYVLRQGETFTRWWTPQGGRWHHHAEYHSDDHFRRLFESEPRGPKCKHAGWSIHTHGNGRFVYRPDLTSAFTDFHDGVYDFDNIATSPAGLTLVRNGSGHAVFEVRSPYVIVPLVGDMTTTDDDREASVVKLEAKGAGISISVDHGLTWTKLAREHNQYDLTPHVSGRYGYLLKLSLAGEPNEAIVRRLEITTWVQVAPASLPALRQGVNRMEFRTGDHYGLQTRVTEIRPNGNNRSDFLKHVHEPPADYDPARKTARAKGQFVVAVPAPPRSRIAWFSAGGNFHALQGESAGQTRNRMEYAVEAPGRFVEFYKAEVPTGQAHWHYNADRTVKLDTPARKVFIRYTGDPGVNNIRIYAHAVDEKPGEPSQVVVTHTWTENGQRQSKSVTLTRPSAYQIAAQGDPLNESVEIQVLSKSSE
jgi:hypothetical protein